MKKVSETKLMGMNSVILPHLLGTTISTQIALLSGTVLCLFKLKSPVSKILLKALSVRALATVGILSYSIYLWHTVIYEIIFVHYGRSLSSKFITVLATLLISYLSYTYVELPLQNFIKRKSIGP
jgi:peptidoglycan/LPS O-acetylase OafA/YrhL